MIRSYQDLFTAISTRGPVTMAVVNSRNPHITDAIEYAESRGWIKAIRVYHDDPAVAAQRAVDHVKCGDARLLMKGDIPSYVLLKAVLDKQSGLRGSSRISHVAVVESPKYPRLMLFTDGGVNVQINSDILESIIRNAVSLSCQLQNDHPHVAMLSLTEKESNDSSEGEMIRAMKAIFLQDQHMLIEGPVSLDVALSRESAHAKNLDSKISGNTDIFVGQNITTINFIVKSLLLLGNAKGGGIVLGGKVPIVLLSRADSMETKVNSIALGVIVV